MKTRPASASHTDSSRAPGRAAAPTGRSSRLVLAALLLIVLGVDLLCMPAGISPGDPFTWREEARSILHGRLAIDEATAKVWLANTEPGQYFVLNEKNGRYYSKYGIANSLMALPPLLVEQLTAGPAAAQWPPQPANLLILNLYQILLCLVVTALLYHLTGRYARRPVTRTLYVLAVLFATFLWYYQRAQTSEIYQVLFFLAFLSCLLPCLPGAAAQDGQPGRQRRYLLGAWLFLALLLMTRLLFALLLPVMVAVTISRIRRGGARNSRAFILAELAWLLAPAVVVFGILGAVHAAKFGSPFLTGYHQWKTQTHLPVGNPWDGLYGFLFDMQGSVLWYFPVLIVALAGWRRFWARHKADACVIGGIFLLFLLFLCPVPTWLGEWTHGPRYMLFVLPAAALPFVLFLDGLLDRPRRWSKALAAAAAAALLIYSGYLQERVNRLDFFAYYYARTPLQQRFTPEVAAYFLNHHRGVICADLLRHRDNLGALPYMKELEKNEVPRSTLDAYIKFLRPKLRDNYYWESR